ncbi:MAG: AMP-binding protein, partial [Pseudomonas sp.]
MVVQTLSDIESLEQVPLSERGLASSTYEALRQAARCSPQAPALSFFADAADFKRTYKWNYSQLFADITRAANAFHDLGIKPGEVLAFILPNLPETHFTIWGGEAAGIVMAINPLLEAKQIAGLLDAAKASVVVTLAPTAGSDLWP